jgi:hypothetical protein
VVGLHDRFTVVTHTRHTSLPTGIDKDRLLFVSFTSCHCVVKFILIARWLKEKSGDVPPASRCVGANPMMLSWAIFSEAGSIISSEMCHCDPW